MPRPTLSDKILMLNEEAKTRYLEKLSLIGVDCPYSYDDSFWRMGKASLSLTPCMDIHDIYSYLVLARNSVSLEQFRAFKSLDSYQHVIQGYVGSFGIYKVNETTLIMKAKVSHSQSVNLPPANPWVACKLDGYVICAHCDCIAGLGESCSHVGAVLFAAMTQSKMKETTSSTEIKCSWLDSYKKPDPCKLLSQLSKVKHAPKLRPEAEIPPASENALNSFLSALKREESCVLDV